MGLVDFIVGWAEDVELLDMVSSMGKPPSAPRVVTVLAVDREAKLWREISLDHTGESSWAAGWVGERREKAEPALNKPFPTSILLRWIHYFPRYVGEERFVAFTGPFETEDFEDSEEAVFELLALAREHDDPLKGIDYRESTRPVDPADLPP
jgi:hypothetical protein